jgi:hypothetical protein
MPASILFLALPTAFVLVLVIWRCMSEALPPRRRYRR